MLPHRSTSTQQTSDHTHSDVRNHNPYLLLLVVMAAVVIPVVQLQRGQTQGVGAGLGPQQVRPSPAWSSFGARQRDHGGYARSDPR